MMYAFLMQDSAGKYVASTGDSELRTVGEEQKLFRYVLFP